MNKRIEKIGQISSDNSQAGTVYSEGGVAPTIIAGTHGYAIGYIVTEICADRQNQLLHRRELLEGNDIGTLFCEASPATGD